MIYAYKYAIIVCLWQARIPVAPALVARGVTTPGLEFGLGIVPVREGVASRSATRQSPLPTESCSAGTTACASCNSDNSRAAVSTRNSPDSSVLPALVDS